MCFFGADFVSAGKKLSQFWMHNGFVNIDNQKMSKSLHNFKTLRCAMLLVIISWPCRKFNILILYTYRDILKNPDDARTFRYMIVSAQVRTDLIIFLLCNHSSVNACCFSSSLVSQQSELHGRDLDGRPAQSAAHRQARARPAEGTQQRC